MSILTKSISQMSANVMNSHKDRIQFVKAGEDSAIAFQSPKQSLHFIALFIQLFVVFPRGFPALLWRNYWI